MKNKNPLRVLLFCGWGYTGIGGVEGFTKNLAESLVKEGQNVSVLTHKLKNEKDEVVNGVKVYYVPKVPRIKYFLPIYIIRFLIIFYKAFLIRLKNKIEIVLTNEPESISFMPLRLFGVKIMVRGFWLYKHLSIEVESLVKNKLLTSFLKSVLRLYQKTVIKLANAVIGVKKEDVVGLKKITNKKPFHLPAAINDKIFYPSNKQNKDILVYHGFLRAVKRIELLIKLFDKIKDRHNKAKLYLIGGLREPYTKEYLLSYSRYKKDIKFLGKKNKQELGKLLRKSGIFIQTAIDFGNSPTEAAACGLPIVALGNFNEDIGIFAKSEREFVNEVVRLLKDKRYYKKESEKNKKYIKDNRSWKVIVKKYIKIFRYISRTNKKRLF